MPGSCSRSVVSCCSWSVSVSVIITVLRFMMGTLVFRIGPKLAAD